MRPISICFLAAALLMISAVCKAEEAAVAQHCSDQAREDFSAVPEASAKILRGVLIEAKGRVPAFCQIDGVVRPNVGFRLRLPVENWNGRFFEVGCGNYCGIIYPTACDDPLAKGYACIGTDSGHVARPEDVSWTDGQWADDNLGAALDWGGRASHVTAVIGKAVTERYYGQAPAKSYFMGCSYGGHQAMALAQRFPWDFDGIVGGGAPNSISGLMQQNAWALIVAYDSTLKPVFSEEDIKVLHASALARCDRDDGVQDGLIGNPGSCRVDVDALICKAGRTSGCLTPDIAAAAKKLYAGPSTSDGRPLGPGGWAPGSEIYWRKVYRPDGTGLAALAPNYFRYMSRYPAIGPDWSTKDYDFDADYKRNDVMETLYSAGNPDLRRFKSAGGKFINYAGWDDLGTVPAGAIDYYETAERTMGGKAATQSFFRLFLIPGALHCRGGEGPTQIDLLSAIEDWVERGTAPDRLLGTHVPDADRPAYSRPIFPYPVSAKYRGAGDPNDAANFEPVAPR